MEGSPLWQWFEILKEKKMFNMVEQLTNLNRILMYWNLIRAVIEGWVWIDSKVQSKNSCQQWGFTTLISYKRMRV